MSWLVLALLGALCTSLTTIFAKIGIKKVNSNFATFYRTGIVVICCIVMCLVTKNIYQDIKIDLFNYLFLIISGISTGLSWIFYYKALQLGSVNNVAPIDKSSFILTNILFLIFFFDDTTKGGNVLIIFALIISMVLMLFGTNLMIQKNNKDNTNNKKWLIYALLSAVFASFVSLFAKIGLKNIPSDIGTLFRTIIVFIFAGSIVFIKKDYKGVKNISKTSWIFLTISGAFTGGAWLCEFYALNMKGVNPVAVTSISKLSILLTMLFSFVFLKEKFVKKTLVGLCLLVIGIIITIIFSL